MRRLASDLRRYSEKSKPWESSSRSLNASKKARRISRCWRPLWSNVELFEVWPRSCEWPDACHGRHPAPFERIKAQLENERPLAEKLIAWEWSSCLSPNNGSETWPEATKANFEAYKAYLAGDGGGR